MRDIRLQFFLTFTMLGTVGPFAAVFFRQRGLSEEQIANAFSLQNLVAILSPAVMTLVADAKIDARRVLSLMSVIAAVSLLAMTTVSGFAQVMAVWMLYCVAQTAILPLQDGLHFSQQRRQVESGGRTRAYHQVRVFAAIGFMTPGIALYFQLKRPDGLIIALTVGAVFAVLAAIQANLLRDSRPKTAPTTTKTDVASRVPTLAALRMLLEPRMLVFCSAIILAYMAFSIHWTFYNVYLTEDVKLGNEWVGIANFVAMCIEIPVTFLCGWLILKAGVKRLVAVGLMLMALRLCLLALTKNPAVVIGTQTLHAFFIIAVGVIPHTILDNRAGDRFRHSMQALFLVLVSCGNAVANFCAGKLSGYGKPTLFVIGAALCAVAATLIVTLWKPDESDVSIITKKTSKRSNEVPV